MQWLNPLRTCLSNIHLVSFLCCLHHSIPQSYIPAAFLHLSVYPLNQKKSEQLTSLSVSLSTQAENMIAGQPAKHEMSGGIRLLYNPLIFKLGWLVVEYGSCSNAISSKYKQKSCSVYGR